jgi:hypothetical protein
MILTINNEKFEADDEMVPLLMALNKVGLKTTQHCLFILTSPI